MVGIITPDKYFIAKNINLYEEETLTVILFL